MNQFRFRDWPVYKSAQQLYTLVLGIVGDLPKEFRFELGSQILRSSSSIILNIAEGSGKQSEKELNRFIETALGSAYETLANLDILLSNGLIDQKNFLEAEKTIKDICSQLGAFKKKLDLWISCWWLVVGCRL